MECAKQAHRDSVKQFRIRNSSVIRKSFCDCGIPLNQECNRPRQKCDACWKKIRAERKKVEREKNPEKNQKIMSEWRARNPDRSKEIARNSYQRNYQLGSGFQVATQLRNRLRNALRANGTKKDLSALELLGCSMEHFREWFELKFRPGMTWENWGEWEIDHIRPCASFDLSDPSQQRQCFEYLNLQPLWKDENRRKSARIL